MNMRRFFKHPSLRAFFGIAILAATFACFVRAEDKTPAPTAPRFRVKDPTAFESVTPEVRKAVERGLAYLASSQNDDGSWTDVIGYKINMEVKGGKGPNVGVTAVACMALMANGNQPGRGRYAKNLDRALKYLLAHVTSSGYITEFEQRDFSSRMYGNAFAVLALSEAAGMLTKEAAENFFASLRLAADLIVKSQHKDGGWRYTPGALDEDSDLSVTVSTLQALRAARNVGVSVPRAAVDKAVEYVKRCYQKRGGYFLYQDIGEGMSRTSYALTACGVVCLLSTGDYQAREIDGGIGYLANQWNEVDYEGNQGYDGQPPFHYFYAHYYAVQAFYQYGGDPWRTYFSAVREDLLREQKSEGNWVDMVGPNYATAMAVIVLSLPMNYLPIGQK